MELSATVAVTWHQSHGRPALTRSTLIYQVAFEQLRTSSLTPYFAATLPVMGERTRAVHRICGGSDYNDHCTGIE